VIRSAKGMVQKLGHTEPMLEVVKWVVKIVARHNPEESLQGVCINLVVIDKPKLIVDCHEIIDQFMLSLLEHVKIAV
jgi:hypothetical protein